MTSLPRPRTASEFVRDKVNRVSTTGLVSDEQLSRWQQDAVWRRAAADRAATEYEYRKPRIQKGIISRIRKHHQGIAEDILIRKEMEANWDLLDLSRTHAWLQAEANSLNLAIQTQLALRAAIAAQNGQTG